MCSDHYDHMVKTSGKTPVAIYNTHLHELPLVSPQRLVGLRVGGKDLRAGELVRDALRERRQLLELQAAVDELLVLQFGK